MTTAVAFPGLTMTHGGVKTITTKNTAGSRVEVSGIFDTNMFTTYSFLILVISTKLQIVQV